MTRRNRHKRALVDEDRFQLLRAPTAAHIIRKLLRPNALDPRLVPTDRHMQRWAASQGTGFEDTARALFPQSHLTPLSPPIAIATDQIVLTSPPHWRRFVRHWYRSDCTVDMLADEFGMSRDKLFIERRIVLAYLLGRLEFSGIRIPTFEPSLDGVD